MNNLIFCLNATLPVFMLMILGYIFHKVGLFDEMVASKMNKFVFKVALPLLLFKDLSASDFYTVWDTGYVLFCFGVSVISIFVSLLASMLLKDKSIQGEFVQAAFRSSPALLGIAFVKNIYGSVGAASLMIIGSVPLYNISSVIILSFLKPQREKMNKALLNKTIRGILTNPLIWGVFIGILWSALCIPQPVIMVKTVGSLAGVATPIGLMALGASFDWGKAFAKLKPAIICSVFKLILFTSLFLPVAVCLGYRNQQLVAILIMLGAATTISSYIMAKNMGHEGTISSSVIMLTTFFSAFTLTGWLYVLKCMELI